MPPAGTLSAELKCESRSADGKFRFRVKVTNRSSKPMRICFIQTWAPTIIGESGRSYQLGGGRDATRGAAPEDVPLLKPGKSASVTIAGLVEKTPKGRSLVLEDRIGGTTTLDELKDERLWICLTPVEATGLFLGVERLGVSIGSLKMFPPTNWISFKP
jgi:hypothetical protein